MLKKSFKYLTILIVFFILISSVAYYIAISRIRNYTINLLQDKFNRNVAISFLYFDFSGNIELHGLRIANPKWCSEANWLRIKNIEVVLDIGKLISTHRLFFKNVRIEAPFFSLEISKNGKDNLPVIGKKTSTTSTTKAETSSVTIEDIFNLLQSERFEIINGSFKMLLQKEEIALTAPSINLYGFKQRNKKPSYLANLDISNVKLTLSDILDVSATLKAKRVFVNSNGCKLTGKPIVLYVGDDTKFSSVKGSLKNFAYPYLSFDVSSKISINDVKKSVFIPTLMRGRANLNGHLEGLADELLVNAKLSIPKQSKVWKLPIQKLSSDVTYKDGAVTLTNLKAFIAKGTLKGSGKLHFLPPLNFKYDAKISNITIQKITRILDLSQPLKGFLHGNVSMSGTDFNWKNIKGQSYLSASVKNSCYEIRKEKKKVNKVNFDHFNKADNLTLDCIFNNGNTKIRNFSGEINKTSFNISGTLFNNNKIAGNYQVASTKLRQLYKTLHSFIVSQKVPQKKILLYNPTFNQPAKVHHRKKSRLISPITGNGIISGKISGSFSKPILDASLKLHKFNLLGMQLGSVSSSFSVTPEILDVNNLNIIGAEGKGKFKGRLILSDFSQNTKKGDISEKSIIEKIFNQLPAFELKGKASSVKIAPLLKIMNVKQVDSGYMDLKVQLSKNTELSGSSDFTFRNISAFNENIFQTNLNVKYSSKTITISNYKTVLFKEKLGLAKISGDGSIEYDGQYKFRLNTETLNSRFFNVFSERKNFIHGIVTASIEGEGSLNKPNIKAFLTFSEFSLFGKKLGLGHVTASLSKNDIDIKANLPDKNVSGKALINFREKTIQNAEIHLNKTDYLLFLALLDIIDEPELSGIANGTIKLSGSYGSLDKITAIGLFDQVNFGFYGYHLNNKQPVTIQLKNGKMSFSPFKLHGNNAWIYLSGYLNLSKHFFSVGAEGSVDLKLLPTIEPEINYAKGNFNFGANLDGPFSNPTLFIDGVIKKASLIPKSLPLEFQDINSRFSLNNAHLTLEKLTAALSNGTITGKGNFYIPPLDKDFNPLNTMVDIKLSANDCEIDYPDGFEGKISADLTLSQQLDTPLITGKAMINSGVYEQEINIRTLLLESIRDVLKSRSTTPPVEETEAGFNPSFNIDIKNEKPVQLVSDDVMSSFNLDLNLYGDLNNLKLRGNMDIVDGDISLDDRDITVSSGLISFFNPNGIFPTLDITGKTVIQNYHIYLTVSGEYPDIIISFNSDENLTKGEILSLLLTGNIAVADRSKLGETESQKFASDIIMSNILNNEIINKVKQLFLIDKFQVTPISVNGSNNAAIGMQITAGTEIGGWYLTYTKTPETTDHDIITAERKLSSRLIVSFIIQNRDASSGGDIRLTFPFP